MMPLTRPVGRPRHGIDRKVTLSAALPPALIEAIDAMSVRQNRPRSAIVAELLSASLLRYGMAR